MYKNLYQNYTQNEKLSQIVFEIILKKLNKMEWRENK